MRRLVYIAATAAAALAALFAAGCGGGASASGSAAGDPATAVPAGAPLFIDLNLAPDPRAAAGLDALGERAGVGDVGDYLVQALGVRFGIDYEADIAPWLGDHFGIYLAGFDGEDFTTAGFALSVTDPDAAREFYDDRIAASDEEVETGSYEGVDYFVETDEGDAIAIAGDLLLNGAGDGATDEGELVLKRMIDASKGDSLAEQETYSNAASAFVEGSAANAFADVGAMIEESGEELDAEADYGLRLLGVEPETATAFASVVPGSDHLEINLRSDLFGGEPLGGDASKALAEMPASSVLAISSSQLGERFGAGFDHLDAIGGDGVPPHQLKRIYRDGFNLDIDQITAAAGEAAAFGEGVSEGSLRGALSIEMHSEAEAADTVAKVGEFLRTTETEGYRKLGGGEPGFFVHDPEELGSEPLVVVAAGRKIVVSYGLAALNTALEAGEGPTVGDSPQFEQAAADLGETPIGLYADGPRALRLAANLLSDDDDFQEALPLLRQIEYLAGGVEPAGDLTAAKLIVGFGE